jgi:hypothetical protein
LRRTEVLLLALHALDERECAAGLGVSRAGENGGILDKTHAVVERERRGRSLASLVTELGEARDGVEGAVCASATRQIRYRVSTAAAEQQLDAQRTDTAGLGIELVGRVCDVRKLDLLLALGEDDVGVDLLLASLGVDDEDL